MPSLEEHQKSAYFNEPLLTSQPTLDKSGKKVKSLMEIIREKAYEIINKFDEMVPGSIDFASFEEFKKVFKQYTENEDEIAQLWGACQIDNIFYYQHELLKISGTSFKPSVQVNSNMFI